MYNNYMNMLFDNQGVPTRQNDNQPRMMQNNYPKVGDIFLYVVKQGDNMYQIARYFQTKPEFIMCFNQLEMGCILQPGQELLIPVVYEANDCNRQSYGLYF